MKPSTGPAPDGARIGSPARHTRREPRRLRRSVRGVILALAAFGTAVTVGAMSGAGTYALWGGAADLGAGVVRIGDPGSGLALTGSIPPAAFADLLPGERVSAQVTIVNDTYVPMDLTATLVVPSAHLDVRLALAGSCGGPLAGTALAATDVPLGELAANAQSPLCVEMTALAGLVPAETADLVVIIRGE